MAFRAAAACALAAFFSLAGCNLDVTRLRENVPLDPEAYEQLDVGRTTMEEALAVLGAPDQLEHKSGLDYLWYLHRDSTRVGLRFESPISLFGYRPTLAEIDVDADDTSSMRLVFENQGLLRHKSLRLAPAFTASETPSPPWSLYLIPRYGLSPLLLGDAGEDDYGELFSMGQVFGDHVGILPVPYFMLLFGGNYQVYGGEGFRAGAARAEVEDLQLYQVEVGGRFELPPEFFVSFWDVQKLKTLFYSEDVSRHRGFFLYFQWTLGATFNEEVGVEIAGAPAGSYFDRSFRFSNTLGGGFSYRWPRLGFHAGIDYQSVDAFDEGNSPLDADDATGLQNIILTAGLSWRF